jgi:hypothetical protein
MGTLNKEEIKNPILLNIIALCESSSRKVTPSKMCTDLELSRSLTTKLKNDPERSISGETALKIADYFGVSVDQVLGSEQKEKSPTPEGAEPFPGYSDLTEEEKCKVSEYIDLLLAARQKR